MFINKQLADIARKLYAVLPNNAQHLEQDIQQKFSEILNIAFNKLDLVTREEFDVQIKVLARTREKVEFLEQQLLEQKSNKQK
jgi:ubiquinone biosynthesis accessory factor UbiK